MKKLSILSYYFGILVLSYCNIIPAHAQNPWIINDDFSSNKYGWPTDSTNIFEGKIYADRYELKNKLPDKSFFATKRFPVSETHDYNIEADIDRGVGEDNKGIGLIIGSDGSNRAKTRPRSTRERMAGEATEVLARAGVGTLEPPPSAPERLHASPRVTRVKRFDMIPMFEEDAITRMEELGHAFFIFLNAETEQLSLVYRRNNGTYGLIEPMVAGRRKR